MYSTAYYSWHAAQHIGQEVEGVILDQENVLVFNDVLMMMCFLLCMLNVSGSREWNSVYVPRFGLGYFQCLAATTVTQWKTTGIRILDNRMLVISGVDITL